MFWFPRIADISSLLATSGVARLMNASIGMKLEPLAYIGYEPSKEKKVLHTYRNCKHLYGG